MKFFCNPTDFSEALSLVSKALSQSPKIPILNGIKIEALGKTLSISASDLEIYIQKKINADILIEGTIVIEGQKSVEFFKKLVSLDMVEITRENENEINVKYRGGNVKLPCMNEAQYPDYAKDELNEFFYIKEKDFKDLLSNSIFSVNAKIARQELRGVNLELSSNTATCVGLDGHRMAVQSKTIENNTKNINILLSHKTASEFLRILSDNAEMLKISVQNKKIYLIISGTEIISCLIDLPYFDYKRIYPANLAVTVIANKNDLLGVIQRANIIAKNNDNNASVKLSLEGDELFISSQGASSNQDEFLNVKANGKEIKIAFHIDYFMQILNHINGEFVKIMMATNLKPAIFTEADCENELNYFLLQPVRMIG